MHVMLGLLSTESKLTGALPTASASAHHILRHAL
jgi:hypothetical protein